MTINTRNPADMRGQERLQKIAAILAAGIERFTKCEDIQGSKAHVKTYTTI